MTLSWGHVINFTILRVGFSYLPMLTSDIHVLYATNGTTVAVWGQTLTAPRPNTVSVILVPDGRRPSFRIVVDF
jgi:hypothetical protein